MRRIASALLSSLVLLGQQPPPAPALQRSEVVFSVTSTLVQVDAVVTDSKGHQVTSLEPTDFEILLDGKPQQIKNFSYVQVASDTAVPERPPVKDQRLKLPPAPSAPLRKEDVRRTIVLMVDDLGLNYEDLVRVRASLQKFVERQMQPGDLVAVCRTGAGSGALQEFTSDKSILLSIIDHLHWNPDGRGGVGLAGDGDSGAHRKAGKTAGRSPSTFEQVRDEDSTYGSLQALSFLLKSLQEMPGRKSIVFISDGIDLMRQSSDGPQDGLPEQSSSVIKALHELIDRANRAGTVIYTMDGRGLASPGVDDTGSSQPPGAQEGATALGDGLLRHTSAVVEETLNRQQQGLASIAQLTGGLAYENGNDLGFGLQRVLDDQRGYYLLGFSPEPGIFTGKRAERRYHQIAVRVTKPGLHVRSRTGFFGETDEDATPRPKTPLEQMRTAMLSPFHSSAIHVRLTPLYAEVRKIGAVVRNLLHVDVRDLRFTTEIDGSASAHIKVFLVAASSGDHPLASEWRDFTLRVPPGAMENSLRDGGAFKMDVVVPNAGPYQIRAAVRDEATAKVGSASQYIEIPDMKKVHWALTSVLLATAAGDAPANGPRAITVARRQFHKGSEIEYFCLLEASKKLKESDLKGLDVTVRLMREGKEVYSGPAKLAEMVDGHRVVGGSLRLGASIVPGDYVLGVIAMDNPRKPKDVAAQWTDFEVVE